MIFFSYMPKNVFPSFSDSEFKFKNECLNNHINEVKRIRFSQLHETNFSQEFNQIIRDNEIRKNRQNRLIIKSLYYILIVLAIIALIYIISTILQPIYVNNY